MKGNRCPLRLEALERRQPLASLAEFPELPVFARAAEAPAYELRLDQMSPNMPASNGMSSEFNFSLSMDREEPHATLNIQFYGEDWPRQVSVVGGSAVSTGDDGLARLPLSPNARSVELNITMESGSTAEPFIRVEFDSQGVIEQIVGIDAADETPPASGHDVGWQLSPRMDEMSAMPHAGDTATPQLGHHAGSTTISAMAPSSPSGPAASTAHSHGLARGATSAVASAHSQTAAGSFPVAITATTGHDARVEHGEAPFTFLVDPARGGSGPMRHGEEMPSEEELADALFATWIDGEAWNFAPAPFDVATTPAPPELSRLAEPAGLLLPVALPAGEPPAVDAGLHLGQVSLGVLIAVSAAAGAIVLDRKAQQSSSPPKAFDQTEQTRISLYPISQRMAG